MARVKHLRVHQTAQRRVRLTEKNSLVVVPELNAFIFGLAGGAVFAGLFLIMGILGLYFNYSPSWMVFIKELYGSFGYSESLGGLIIGTAYALIDGFILTGLFAWIYNKLS